MGTIILLLKFWKIAGAKGYETQNRSSKVWSPHPDDPIFQILRKNSLGLYRICLILIKFNSGGSDLEMGEYLCVW